MYDSTRAKSAELCADGWSTAPGQDWRQRKTLAEVDDLRIGRGLSV
jgi:hypothetical protein